jgi:hypothetical protein
MFKPPDQKEGTMNVTRIAKLISLLKIVTDNAELFPNGFNVENDGCISVYVYDRYDDNGDILAGSAKTDMANLVKTLRRITQKTSADKGANDYYFYVDINQGDDRLFRIQAARNSVCTKVVTGTKEIEEPDYDNVPKVKKTVEIVEWQCDPILEGA